MATPEAAIYSLLTTDSPNAVADLVGTRVYPDVLPQGVVYPAIRFQRISTARGPFRDLTGFANYARVRMQIDIWALTRMEALEIAQAVFGVLEGFRGTVTDLRIDAMSNEDESGEFAAGNVEGGVGPGGAHVYRQRLDFFLWFPE